MKKTLLIILTASILLVFLVTFLAFAFPFESKPNKTEYGNELSMWTKAICNEKNYCIDVQIECNGNKMINLKPLGEGIYFSEEWKDPRPEELRNKLC